MSKLDIIANRVGSPWGEGADYSHNQDISHFDNESYDLFKNDVKDLFLQLVIDSLEENPINPLETLRIKIGEL